MTIGNLNWIKWEKVCNRVDLESKATCIKNAFEEDELGQFNYFTTLPVEGTAVVLDDERSHREFY